MFHLHKFCFLIFSFLLPFFSHSSVKDVFWSCSSSNTSGIDAGVNVALVKNNKGYNSLRIKSVSNGRFTQNTFDYSVPYIINRSVGYSSDIDVYIINGLFINAEIVPPEEIEFEASPFIQLNFYLKGENSGLGAQTPEFELRDYLSGLIYMFTDCRVTLPIFKNVLQLNNTVAVDNSNKIYRLK